jgi:hypothetical protein
MKSLETILVEHKKEFASVIEFNPLQQRLIAMNFTADNPELNEHYIAGYQLVQFICNTKN